MVALPDEPVMPEDCGQHQADPEPSLEDVLDLLAAEIERLQVSLETYRLGDHPSKQALIRWHVQQIDVRHDRLEEIKQMILKRNNDAVH
ncbi:MAG: hypothetical protein ACFHXK_05110 [bacterium]